MKEYESKPLVHVTNGTATPNLSSHQVSEVRNLAFQQKVVILEIKASDEAQAVFEDPEVANMGCSKRPMILTHALMVGLTLILLIVLEGIIVSKVRCCIPDVENISKLILSHRCS